MELGEEELGGGIPDVEHVDTVMDGIIDTVTGTEGLTHAQRYLAGALYASGAVSYSQYHGSEGVMDTIKGGLKKAWDYVVKMFKQIWGFFFKSKGKQEAAEAKAAVKQLEEFNNLRPVKSEDRRRVVTEMVRAGAKMAHMDLDKTDPRAKRAMMQHLEAMKEKSKEMQHLTPAESSKEAAIVADVKKDFQEICAEHASVNLDNLADKVVTMLETVYHANEKLDHLKQDAKEDLGITWLKGISRHTDKFISEMRTFSTVLRDFRSTEHSSAFAGKLRGYITSIETMMDNCIKTETSVRTVMQRVEKELAANPNDGTNIRSLEHLKLGLSLSAKVAETISWLLRTTTTLCRHYSVKA
ncbi:hypothetical protein JOAD_5 [Erwinia phage vB_EamM_Joad]|uniref:Uncharacterized protein n=1 Tax=Erwinia phage vB_EamM_Joad TaxID=2026081 RepID=A0A223LIV6_9CAUD|nr:hypothetical protein JOAD_5 [Erwinia phage vB_EamM_Joad]